MTEDTTRTQLEDIARMWPLLEDIQAAHYHPASSTRANLAGTHGDPQHSPTVAAVERIERITHTRLHVELLAHEWGYRHGDGPHTLYLLRRWDWARTHMPADHAERITHIHTTLTRLVREHPLPTGTTCPVCGQQTLAETVAGNHWCATCDRLSTPAETQTLAQWVLATSDAHTTPATAARILGIAEQTVYSWIRRGKLARTSEGISLKAAHALSQETHHNTRCYNAADTA